MNMTKKQYENMVWHWMRASKQQIKDACKQAMATALPDDAKLCKDYDSVPLYDLVSEFYSEWKSDFCNETVIGFGYDTPYIKAKLIARKIMMLNSIADEGVTDLADRQTRKLLKNKNLVAVI